MLLSLRAAIPLHDGRSLMQQAREPRCSRTHFRQLLLKTAARVTLGQRYITVLIDAGRATEYTGALRVNLHRRFAIAVRSSSWWKLHICREVGSCA